MLSHLWYFADVIMYLKLAHKRHSVIKMCWFSGILLRQILKNMYGYINDTKQNILNFIVLLLNERYSD